MAHAAQVQFAEMIPLYAGYIPKNELMLLGMTEDHTSMLVNNVHLNSDPSIATDKTLAAITRIMTTLGHDFFEERAVFGFVSVVDNVHQFEPLTQALEAIVYSSCNAFPRNPLITPLIITDINTTPKVYSRDNNKHIDTAPLPMRHWTKLPQTTEYIANGNVVHPSYKEWLEAQANKYQQ